MKVFCTGKIKLHHEALENERVRIGMYFSEHKLVVDLDEKGHIDRNQNNVFETQIKIEKLLNGKFHRINPDAKNFDIFVEISKIQNYITKSNKDKMKKTFTRELLSYMSSFF